MNRLSLPLLSERGQSLALVALMLAGLVAFVGLALDGGQVYEMRRRMQNSADAATLAGARELGACELDSSSPSCSLVGNRVYQYAVSYSDDNGSYVFGNRADTVVGLYVLDNGSTQPIVAGVPAPGNAHCVRATSTKTFSTLIISFLGFNTLSASATATACPGALKGAQGVRPIGVYKPVFDGLTPGDTVVLAAGNTRPASGTVCDAPQGTMWLGSNSGSFAWYDLNGGNNSAADTFQWVQTGYNDWITVNGNIESDVGWRSTTQAAWDSVMANGGEIFIPIYDSVNDAGGGNLTYHIVDFAAFKVTYVSMQGNANVKCIKMTFEKHVLPGDGDVNRKCSVETLSCGVVLTE